MSHRDDYLPIVIGKRFVITVMCAAIYVFNVIYIIAFLAQRICSSSYPVQIFRICKRKKNIKLDYTGHNNDSSSFYFKWKAQEQKLHKYIIKREKEIFFFLIFY